MICQQTPFNGIIDVDQQLIEGVTLSYASGYGWYFGPITPFFRIMYDHFQFHKGSSSHSVVDCDFCKEYCICKLITRRVAWIAANTWL